jgi:hypothetical protein
MNLPFEGNSEISRVELPVLILVTKYSKTGKRVPCDQRGRSEIVTAAAIDGTFASG